MSETTNEFNENNPKFIAYVNMLDALIDKGLLKKDPADKNRILIYYTNLPIDAEITEGWFSRNIFDVANELFHIKENRDSLYEVLKEEGIEPVFTPFGEFDYLKNFEKEREIN